MYRVRCNQKLRILWLTSKPLSKLLKASFNPLVAEEIFSNTVPISVRWSSKRADDSRGPVSVFGRTLDSSEPYSMSAIGAERARLGTAEVLASGLSGSGLLHDDTSGPPAPWGREAGGVSLSIISGKRSPEDEPC